MSTNYHQTHQGRSTFSRALFPALAVTAPSVSTAIAAVVADIVKDWTANALINLLVEADVPCTPVNRLEDLLNDPHLSAIDFITEEDHPTEGIIKNTGIPIRFSKSPGALRRHAPALGEHSVELLSEIGYSDADIETLLANGVTAA